MSSSHFVNLWALAARRTRGTHPCVGDWEADGGVRPFCSDTRIEHARPRAVAVSQGNGPAQAGVGTPTVKRPVQVLMASPAVKWPVRVPMATYVPVELASGPLAHSCTPT